MAKRNILGKTHPAVISVWAAIIAIANVLPSIPMIGTGATFSFETAIVPLTGIFFGPVPGLITAAIGGFIGNLLAPHTAWMGMGTFILPAIAAFVSGLIAEGRWKTTALALVLIAVGTGLWFSHPTGRAVPLIAIVYYGSGVITTFVATILVMKGFLLASAGRKAVAIWFIAYSTMIATATFGNYFGLILFQIPAEVWTILVVQSPIQRIIFSVGSAIIGVPLLIGLPKIGVFVGPDAEEPEEDT